MASSPSEGVRASCIKSKQTTASITPPAKLRRRETIFDESFFMSAPIRPPMPVPTHPAMNVTKATHNAVIYAPSFF